MFRPDAYLRNAFGLVLLIVCYNLFAREDIDGIWAIKRLEPPAQVPHSTIRSGCSLKISS